MDDAAFPLMTRRQLVEFVQRQTGIPLTYSRLCRTALPDVRRGPPRSSASGICIPRLTR